MLSKGEKEASGLIDRWFFFDMKCLLLNIYEIAIVMERALLPLERLEA